MSFERSTEMRHVENGSPEAQSKDLAPLTEGRLSNLERTQNKVPRAPCRPDNSRVLKTSSR